MGEAREENGKEIRGWKVPWRTECARAISLFSSLAKMKFQGEAIVKFRGLLNTGWHITGFSLPLFPEFEYIVYI